MSTNSRQLVVSRNGSSGSSITKKRTTFAPASPSSSADRRGRLSREDADDLVNTVKAFAGKTSETVDKYEEARKKSKINRFFKGVRGVFPKRKKNKKDNTKQEGRSRKRSGADDASSSASSSTSEDEKTSRRYTKQERKEREIGGGKFQEKERRKREQAERTRQAELEARRRQRKGSAAGYPDEDDEHAGKRSDGSDDDGRRSDMKKQKQLLLKRAQSSPAAATVPLDKEDKPHGIREKYRAKLEAKKAAALAELQKEEEEKEQERQRQVAKVEEAAIDSFLERAAQRRRGTQERVGFRSKRASVDKVDDKGDSSESESESEDEDAVLRRRLGLTKESGSSKKGKSKMEKVQERGKDLERTASARPYKKVGPAKGRSEPQMTSGSMGSIATSAAIGGAKLVGRYVQQRLEDSEDVERESDEEIDDEPEEERAHRFKDKERERKVKERIDETRRMRQAQEQGRRPSLGKSYSWASPRSGDIPVPMTSRDRMMAAVEGAAARNSPRAAAAYPSPRASPSAGNGGGSGDRTLWHRKARVIRERSQRNLTGGASKTDMRTTSERKLPSS